MDAYAVIEKNEVIFVGTYNEASDYRQKRIALHESSDSWHAFYKPKISIYLAQEFTATGQFHHPTNSFWLFVRNDRELNELLGDCKKYVIKKRKTTDGQREFAMNYSKTVISKIGRILKARGLDFDEYKAIGWTYCNGKAFARVFTDYVFDYEDKKSREALLKPTKLIDDNKFL